MEDTDESAPVRSSNARVSQACQRCRTLKTRCLPSERPGTCQRCVHARRDCIWAETPRRQRRTRGPSRISQVEQKIDGLVASLTAPETASTSVASTTQSQQQTVGTNRLAQRDRPIGPGSWLPFPDSFEQQPQLPENNEQAEYSNATDDVADAAADIVQNLDYLEKLRSIHNFEQAEGTHGAAKDKSHVRQSKEPPIDDDTVRNLLSSHAADDLLDVYQSMCTTFPFVPIETSITAIRLHEVKPMLFLAVITVASWNDHKLQRHLDRVYRKCLANYTFVQPRRNISLLQSILVYLSRYHFVFSHKTQQIFFMQTTAIGLALDLGLHQKIVKPIIELPGRPPPPNLSVTEQYERQRTYLGCYYLSSLVAGGLQKPNLLKYTDYMGQCSQELSDTRQFPSDAIIRDLIMIRRLDDQIYEYFFTEDTIDLNITDPRILMNFRFLKGQLDEWKRVIKNDGYGTLVDLSSAFADMLLNSVALRPEAMPDKPTTNDGTRLNALLATLEACKSYFDTILAIPVSEYHIIAFPDWSRIPVVVITLARLCISSGSHTAARWDVKAAHERGRLDLYLESLCYRMKGLSTYKRTQNFHMDFYWVMEMIMDMTRTWFMKKLSPRKTVSDGIPTPDTLHSFAQGSVCGAKPVDTASQIEFPGSDYNDTPRTQEAPLAFMQDVDFDLDRFFDIGIWGDESYLNMGFGGGARF